MEEKKPKFVSTESGISVEEPSSVSKEEDERRRDEMKEQKRHKEYEESCKKHDMPPMTFTTLVMSLSTATLVQFGDMPDLITGKREKNLLFARQNIDLLGLLQEKTKGNLANDEKEILEDALFKLRLRFIELCKEEQKQGPEGDKNAS